MFQKLRDNFFLGFGKRLVHTYLYMYMTCSSCVFPLPLPSPPHLLLSPPPHPSPLPSSFLSQISWRKQRRLRNMGAMQTAASILFYWKKSTTFLKLFAGRDESDLGHPVRLPVPQGQQRAGQVRGELRQGLVGTSQPGGHMIKTISRRIMPKPLHSALKFTTRRYGSI